MQNVAVVLVNLTQNWSVKHQCLCVKLLYRIYRPWLNITFVCFLYELLMSIKSPLDLIFTSIYFRVMTKVQMLKYWGGGTICYEKVEHTPDNPPEFQKIRWRNMRSSISLFWGGLASLYEISGANSPPSPTYPTAYVLQEDTFLNAPSCKSACQHMSIKCLQLPIRD